MGNLLRASAFALPQVGQAQGAGGAASAPVPTASAKLPDNAAQTPESAVKAWNDALNRHDLDALRAAYAPEVLFYGRHLTGTEVFAMKAQAFAKDPDFQQEVSDFVTSEATNAVTVRLTKSWTTKGVTRRVGGSLGLTRVNGRFLVTAETDVATSQTKGSWSCGKCRNSDKAAPDLLTPSGVEREYFAWSVEVSQGDRTRKAELSDVLQPVDLGGVAGWSCTVSAAQGHLAKGPMKESSSF